MAAQQVELHLTVVLADDTPLATVLAGLAGRELPSVPGSWIAQARLADPYDDRTGQYVDDFDEVLDAEADADAGLVELD